MRLFTSQEMMLSSLALPSFGGAFLKSCLPGAKGSSSAPCCRGAREAFLAAGIALHPVQTAHAVWHLGHPTASPLSLFSLLLRLITYSSLFSPCPQAAGPPARCSAQAGWSPFRQPPAGHLAGWGPRPRDVLCFCGAKPVLSATQKPAPSFICQVEQVFPTLSNCCHPQWWQGWSLLDGLLLLRFSGCKGLENK